MEAEREAVDLKKCVFMRERLGDCFDATVTRIARHGFYATLDAFFVDGLVPLRARALRVRRAQPRADRARQRRALRARRSRTSLSRVDLVRGWIDFEILEHAGEGARRKQGRARRETGSRCDGPFR
jgi:ribonuclease R